MTLTFSNPPRESAWHGVIRHDLPASIVVFLVALPLSMGIALASGATVFPGVTVFSGLIAAAVGGIVVGLLGGAPLQVSGPAAGMAVVVFDLTHRYGFRAVCIITAMAGVLQLLLGLARVGRVVMAISPAVLHGMLAGIGILIALSQLHVLLGDKPQESAWKNILALPEQVRNLHGVATTLGLATIALLILWPLLPTKRLRVPPSLVAVGTISAIGVVWDREVPHVALPDGMFSSLALPSWPQTGLGELVAAVFTVGLLASAESLISAVATDKLHAGPRARLDRELMAQGTANLLSGVLGGLPITGVIVRSTANIDAGGRTRWSAILHGVWILCFVGLLGGLLKHIPLSVLAALLVVVGAKLVNPSDIRSLIRQGEGLVYFTTLGGVVGINLLAGIGLGIGVALAQLLWRLSRVNIVKRHNPDGRWEVSFRGYLTFLAVPQMSAVLASIPSGSIVDVDLDTEVLDHAAFEALHAWRVSHERTGGTVDIDLAHDHALQQARSRARSNTGGTSADLQSEMQLAEAATRR